MASAKDKIVQDLIKKSQEKKAEITKAESKPKWETNCSFSYVKDSTSNRINLQTVSDTDEFINILAFLIEKEKAFNEAKKELGLEGDFKWMGFTMKEWRSDITTRVNKITVTKKKKEFEEIEKRLNSLISKEMREELELEELQKMLEK